MGRWVMISGPMYTDIAVACEEFSKTIEKIGVQYGVNLDCDYFDDDRYEEVVCMKIDGIRNTDCGYLYYDENKYPDGICTFCDKTYADTPFNFCPDDGYKLRIIDTPNDE